MLDSSWTDAAFTYLRAFKLILGMIQQNDNGSWSSLRHSVERKALFLVTRQEVSLPCAVLSLSST